MIKSIMRTKGITLIALVITIVVMLILAGVSLNLVIGDNGIFTHAMNSRNATEAAYVRDTIRLAYNGIYIEQFLSGKSIDEYYKADGGEGKTKLEEAISISSEGKITVESYSYSNGKISMSCNYNGKTYEEELNIVGGQETQEGLVADGTWDEIKQVNTPKLMTGMTGVYWDESGNEVTVTSENQENWYDYSSNKWANAKTEDGSYWVWIPRYAYKITSNVGISGETTSGGIDIVFLEGTTNKKGSTEYATTYPTVSSNAMQDYVVHPAFRNGSTTKYMNGEWDKDIPGFWVAKYAAGFQTCTTSASDATSVINGSDTIVYSSKTYSDNSNNANAIGQDPSSKPAMSYPVFKPLTYAYNCIYIGDIYTLTQEIDGKDIDGNAASNASSFYGLSSSQTDSHMMKNSEWGAVAYLMQSNYGRSGTEVSINGKNLDNLNSKNIYAITGYEGETANGTGASSTNNMSGVFDLNGCILEYVAGYVSDGVDYLSVYGSSFANTTANATGYQTLSTKYATVYPYNSSSDSDANNWPQYNSLKSSTYGYGDAILETSSAGSGMASWNKDYSIFADSSSPFFKRGGCYNIGSDTGTFAFCSTRGGSYYYNGFRAVLVAL